MLSQRMLLNDSGTPRALGSFDTKRFRIGSVNAGARMDSDHVSESATCHLEERVTLLSHQAIGSRQR